MKRLFATLMLGVSLLWGSAHADEYSDTRAIYHEGDHALVTGQYYIPPRSYYQEALVNSAVIPILAGIIRDTHNELAAEITVGGDLDIVWRSSGVAAVGNYSGFTAWKGGACQTTYGSTYPWVMHIVAPRTGTNYCLVGGANMPGAVSTDEESIQYDQEGIYLWEKQIETPPGVTEYKLRIEEHFQDAMTAAGFECWGSHPNDRLERRLLIAGTLGGILEREGEMAEINTQSIILADTENMEAFETGVEFVRNLRNQGIYINDRQIADRIGDLLRNGDFFIQPGIQVCEEGPQSNSTVWWDSGFPNEQQELGAPDGNTPPPPSGPGCVYVEGVEYCPPPPPTYNL